ncbi:MAG: aminotransferase class I/II-fold pyridoxal phosphate-dependent enzyme [Gemmatimonadales bacterium]
MARELNPFIAASGLDPLLERELEELRGQGLRRSLRTVERVGGMLSVDGRPVVDFASNDYLALGRDPRVIAAARAALERHGAGAAASRSLAGTTPCHEEVETELALLYGAPAALAFSSGYAANVGTLSALAGEGDVVYSDASNHASIVDGCRLARARVRVFPHADLDALDRMLATEPAGGGRRIVVVEGVYSMDGDLFPLPDLIAVARRREAMIYLDDGHAAGVLGPEGAGTAAHFGAASEVEVTLATLGKSFGGAGGAIIGSATLRELLLNRARSFIFSTGMPPAVAAGVAEAVRISRAEPWRRERLRANGLRLRRSLADLGWRVPEGLVGHIVPLEIGDPDATVRLGERLLAAGFLVAAVRPPTVPPGSSRLRLTVSTAHSDEQIDGLVSALGAPAEPPA